MRILITGGIGFIGTNLADRFLSDGHEVVLFDNFGRAGVDENLNWLRRQHRDRILFVKGDVRDFAAVEVAMRGADVVFHFAAQVAVTTSVTNPQEDFSINAQGTLNVLEAARHQRPMPTVLYTSTNKVYGGLDHLHVLVSVRPVMNSRIYRTVCPRLALSTFIHRTVAPKGAADQYVHDYHRIYGLRTIVFRMSCIYGPRQFGNEDQGWVAHFALTGLSGGNITIYGDGKQVRDLLYVDDLVDLMMLAISRIDRTAGEIYNVGGGPANTISVWVELQEPLSKLLDQIPKVTYDQFRPGDQRVYISDISRLSEHLRWSPKIAVSDGLSRMIKLWGPEWVARVKALRSAAGNG